MLYFLARNLKIEFIFWVFVILILFLVGGSVIDWIRFKTDEVFNESTLTIIMILFGILVIIFVIADSCKDLTRSHSDGYYISGDDDSPTWRGRESPPARGW
jgi:uncharacterized membrane protein